MKFEITRTKNGWLFKEEDEEIKDSIVQEEYDDEVDAFVNLLRSINEHYGPTTSRYSDKRIRIKVVPGDKNEAWDVCSKCDQEIEIPG